MSKFYEARPYPLPPTLPAGTRINHKDWYATSVLTLNRSHSGYDGEYDGAEADRSGPRPGHFFPDSILWSSVPIPDATPECAACGPASQTLHPLAGDTSFSIGLRGELICVACSDRPALVCERIRARRAAISTPGSGEARSESDCRKCGEPVCVCGDRAQPLCSTPACLARGVVATHSGMCGYCAHSHGISINGKRWREVPDVDRESADDEVLSETVKLPEQFYARARLAVWELAGKPHRVNQAERKSLAAGHPSTWPSNEGEG